MSEILLEGRNLIREFPVKRNFFTGRPTEFFRAVDDVSICLYEGETLGIVGESGSGKSTTGEMLGDLQHPTAGQVLYRGKDLRTLTKEEYRTFRRNVQFIFQDPKGSLNPNARIEEVLTEPLITLQLEPDEEKRRAKAAELIEAVGLESAVLQKYAGEISGGQCQRIAIARALITEPEVIICDEAVSALDVSVQAQILNLLRDLQDRTDVSYLFISHDIGVVNFMADRIAVMQNGKLIEVGTAQQVLRESQQPYTQQLLECSFAKRNEN